MSRDYCRGCGSILQSKAPDAPGYIPENVLRERRQLICQRCFQITHYGQAGKIQPPAERIQRQIQKALELSKLTVLVADFADLTGSLPVWQAYLGRRPYWLAVNKIDLLPPQTKEAEVREYLRQYLDRAGMPKPEELFLVSGATGVGVEKIIRRLAVAAPEQARIAVLGAANVGKSSLIKRIISNEAAKVVPTVAKFPGTTLGLSNWNILNGRNTLIDTPGLVTGRRVGDLLCAKCGSFLSFTKIEQKLWGVKPGKGLILGSLLGLENQGETESVLICFAARGVISHRTDRAKVFPLLQEQPEWLTGFCKKCRQTLNWQTFEISLEPNQDFAVAGLGWVSLRGQTAALKVTLPAGIDWEVRAALIGRKD